METNQQQLYDQAKSIYGFVPNLIKEMAVSPVPAKLYLIAQEFLKDGVLNVKEQNAIQLALATDNGCHYCVPAHWAAGKMAGMDDCDLDAIRKGQLPANQEFNGLIHAARLIHSKQGRLNKDDHDDLKAWGIDRAKLYEIVVLLALKTLTHNINHIAQTIVDEEIKAAAPGINVGFRPKGEG